MIIRPDYWQSIYSGSTQVEAAEQKRSYQVVATVECGDLARWAPHEIPGSVFELLPALPVAFVDGVRRIDLYGVIEGNPPSYGAFGSVAAGCMLMAGSGAQAVAQALQHVEVHRYFVHNSDENQPGLELAADPSCPFHATYKMHPRPDLDPSQFSEELNNLMQVQEHRVAQAMVEQAATRVVITDGPIPYEHLLAAGTGKLVGLIKNVQKRYLEAEQFALVLQLQARQRTPLFEIRYGDGSRNSKLSFFLRLREVPAFGSSTANLVRMELPIMATAEAVRLADLASAAAVHYASNLWADNRAPQNLYPVGALETALKNRLGDQRFLRNLLLRALATSEHSGA